MANNIPASTALAICRMKRERLNEVVSSGYFNCAPSTQRRAGRMYDVNDVITLYILTQLLDGGLKTASAGSLACQANDALTSGRAINSVQRTVDAAGKDGFSVNGIPVRGQGPPVTTISVDLIAARVFIAAELAAVGIDPEASA